FFSIAVLMAMFTSKSWLENAVSPSDRQVSTGTRRLTLLAGGGGYLQLFFGAGFRHSGISILPHMVNAGITSTILLWTAIRVLIAHGRVRELRTPAAWILGLLFVQLGLGFAAYLTRVIWGKDAVQPLPSMVYTTVAHVAVGALLLAATFVLAVQAHRRALRLAVIEKPASSAHKAVVA